MRHQLVFFLTVFLSIPYGRLSAEPLILDEGPGTRNLGSYLEYLEDRDKSLSIRDLSGPEKETFKWQKSKKAMLGFGFTESAYWVRLTVINYSEKEFSWLLEEDYPLNMQVDLYIPSGDGNFKKIESGFSRKFSRRQVKYRTIVFPLKTPPGAQETVYLRYESQGNINIVLKSYTPGDFKRMKDRDAPVQWMLYGIMIIMVFYNLFIFLSSRNLSYLYYMLYIAGTIILYWIMYGIAPMYILADSEWTGFSIPFINGILFALIVMFGREFIRTRRSFPAIDRGLIFLAAVNLLGSLFGAFLNSLQTAVIITASTSGLTIVTAYPALLYMAYVKNHRQAKFLTAALSLLAAWVSLYLLKTIGILSDNFITAYGMQIGFAAMIILLSFGLADQINFLQGKVESAARKYRRQAEGADDIIFTLDRNFTFISVNRAVTAHLGHRADDVIYNKFTDFIQEDRGKESGINRMLVMEYMRELEETRGRVEFKTAFRTRHSHEHKELSVAIEYAEEEKVYRGKAAPLEDDLLIKFLKEERHRYRISSYLTSAEIISRRLTRNLTRYTGPMEANEVRSALRECLLNAIEHGSLNISNEEKAEALNEDRYPELVKTRRKDPRYRDRKVFLEYTLDEKKAAYKIADEGEGFDHRAVMRKTAKSAKGGEARHGRGLLLAGNVFDEMRFNSRGNQVLLVKYFGAR